MPTHSETTIRGGYQPFQLKKDYHLDIFGNAIDKITQQHEKALEQRAAIQAALANIKLNAAEDEWKTNYINNIQKQIDNAAQFGNYATALTTASALAGNVLSDPALLGRQRANAEYEKYKTQVEANKELNQVTKDRWLEQNPYSYEDKYDKNGNIVGGTNWTPNWRPVDRYDMTRLYELTKQLAAEEAGGGESAQFLDENGNLTSDPSKGFYGMAVKRGSKWERLSKEKLQNVFNSLFRQAPEAMDSLLQDMDDRRWQYDKATDEGKKSFIGTDLIKDDGTFRSPQEYLSYRVNPILSEMAYNRNFNTIDFGGAYAARAKALKDAAGRQALLDAQQLQNNTTMTVPIEIDLKDRAGRAYGTINTAMNTIQNLYEGTGVINNPQYKKLINDGNYRGLSDYLKGFTRWFKDNPKKVNEFNAALRLLREEGDNVKAVLDGLGKDDRKAVITYFNIQSGITPKDAADNEFTRETAQLKNHLFSYNTPNGKREMSDNIAIQFANNAYINNFFKNLGIDQRDAQNYGITVTTYEGRPTVLVNKNTNILSDIADANKQLQKSHFWSEEPSKLYNVRQDGSYSSEGVYGHNSTAKLNAMSRKSTYFSRLENKVDNIFKRAGFTTIEPLQVMPYDDRNTLMLNNLWLHGGLEDAAYKEIKKEFEDNNIKELGFAMQHPNNYNFYAATEENGNAVKLSQSEVEDRKENLLRALDQGLVEIAPSSAPTGKGYGTIVRIKGKAKRGDNKEVKNDIMYIDGLFDGPASQAIARNPETLANHSFKTARAMGTRIEGIDGNYINYNSPSALAEYKAAKLLDEVYNDLDDMKLAGRRITASEATAVANSLIQKSGRDINSDEASSIRATLVSKLLRY